MTEARRNPLAVLRWVRVPLALALVAIVAARAGLAELFNSGAAFRPAPFAGAIAVTVVAVGIRAVSQDLLLNRPERVLSRVAVAELTLVGAGLNLIAPSGVSDLAKAGWGSRFHGNAEAILVSSVIDKVTSLVALGVMGAAGAFAVHRPAVAVIACALAIVAALPLAAPRAVPWRLLLRVVAPGTTPDPVLIEAAHRVPPALVAGVVALSLAGWLTTYSAMWMCCLAVGANVGLPLMLAIGPVTTMARLVPISVAGLGVGEVTLALLLGRAGVDGAVAARASLLSMAVLVLLPGAIGALLITRERRRHGDAAAEGAGS